MKYKITLQSFGGTEKLFADNLTEKEAIAICEAYGYEWESPDGGYVWDMVIESEE